MWRRDAFVYIFICFMGRRVTLLFWSLFYAGLVSCEYLHGLLFTLVGKPSRELRGDTRRQRQIVNCSSTNYVILRRRQWGDRAREYDDKSLLMFRMCSAHYDRFMFLNILYLVSCTKIACLTTSSLIECLMHIAIIVEIKILYYELMAFEVI